MNTKRKNSRRNNYLIGFGVSLVVCAAGIMYFLNSIPTYEKHRPLLDLLDSHLMTPSGPIPFEFSNLSSHFPDDEKSAGKRVFATIPASEKAPGFRVSLAIFDTGGKGLNPDVFLSLFTSDYDSGKFAIQSGAYYRLDQEPKSPLTVTSDIGKHGRPKISDLEITLSFHWPQPLSDYNVKMHGGELDPSKVPIIKAGENNSYYLYLPFTFGTEEFAIHLRFKVSVHTSQSIGTWGP